MRALVVVVPLLLAVTAQAQPRCHSATMLEPQPFLGTAEEIIVLSDGSVWKDLSYKYLYLYAYSPRVTICPSQGLMIVHEGSRDHKFSVMRIK